MKKALIFGGLALVLGVVTFAIVRKEDLLGDGKRMFVELVPADPRSLIQGDYMRLDYEIARVASSMGAVPREGRLVVRLDRADRAYFARLYKTGSPLAAGEHLLEYRVRGGRIRIGTDAFHFQEGEAAKYQNARFGELRVDENGKSVLVGLRDEQLRPLDGATQRS